MPESTQPRPQRPLLPKVVRGASAVFVPRGNRMRAIDGLISGCSGLRGDGEVTAADAARRPSRGRKLLVRVAGVTGWAGGGEVGPHAPEEFAGEVVFVQQPEVAAADDGA